MSVLKTVKQTEDCYVLLCNDFYSLFFLIMISGLMSPTLFLYALYYLLYLVIAAEEDLVKSKRFVCLTVFNTYIVSNLTSDLLVYFSPFNLICFVI